MNPETEKIRSFANLPEGWDSYGASIIAAAAISKAIEIVEYLDDMALDESLIVNAFPTPAGSVQLDIDSHATGRGVEIECDSTGLATVSYFDKANEEVIGLRPDVHCDTIERFLLGA